MILGRVNANREAIIQIVVLNDRKNSLSIRGVIDTGYTGDIMLPKSIVEQLGLPAEGFQKGSLADGSSRMFEMYAGLVIWDGSIREATVNVAETGVLIGMRLLENHKLEVVAKPGGEVRIASLS